MLKTALPKTLLTAAALTAFGTTAALAEDGLLACSNLPLDQPRDAFVLLTSGYLEGSADAAIKRLYPDASVEISFQHWAELALMVKASNARNIAAIYDVNIETDEAGMAAGDRSTELGWPDEFEHCALLEAVPMCEFKPCS